MTKATPHRSFCCQNTNEPMAITLMRWFFLSYLNERIIEHFYPH